MSACATSIERVGVVVALPAEACSLGAGHGLRAGACVGWEDGWLAVSGVGRHNAMRAAERLLACGITSLASWGVAGALDASLACGDVLIAERVRYRDDDAGFAADVDHNARLTRKLAGALPVRHGVLWSALQPVATSLEKRALAERTGALAVDMEAAAVAAVAARAQLPFIAVKAICDPLAREIPPRIAHALDAGGGVSRALLSSVVLGGPASWRAARALASDFARARRALATAARRAALSA